MCSEERTVLSMADESRNSSRQPLSVTHPEIAQQFVEVVGDGRQQRNPDNITHGSKARCVWQCKEGHRWEAAMYSRTGKGGHGCPVCYKARAIIVPLENSLQSVLPDVAAQWVRPVSSDDSRRTPRNTSYGSQLRVVWRCAEAH